MPNNFNCNFSTQKKIMTPIYFQPKGIRAHACEVGMISYTDPLYIWYLDEPCKILLSEVKIIDKENVFYNKKSKSHEIIKL